MRSFFDDDDFDVDEDDWMMMRPFNRFGWARHPFQARPPWWRENFRHFDPTNSMINKLNDSVTSNDNFVPMPAIRLDVHEHPNHYTLTAEMPGMSKGNVSVSIEEGVLTMSGERKSEISNEDKDRKMIRTERSFGSFQRSLQLPEDAVTETEKIEAKFENGVLQLTIPRIEKKKELKKQININ